MQHVAQMHSFSDEIRVARNPIGCVTEQLILMAIICPFFHQNCAELCSFVARWKARVRCVVAGCSTLFEGINTTSKSMSTPSATIWWLDGSAEICVYDWYRCLFKSITGQIDCIFLKESGHTDNNGICFQICSLATPDKRFLTLYLIHALL